MTIHSRIPNEWILASIADIAEVRGGKRLPKGKALLDEKTPFPYIRVSDLKDGSIDPSNLKYLDPKTQSAISQYTISSADLYISIAGSIGVVGGIPDYLDGANLTENAAKLCNLTGIHKEFLRHVLSALSAIEQFQDKMTSSGQPKLALFRIKECIFPFPPAAEQKVIADKLDTLLAQVESTKARLERIPQILKRLRQSVLAAAVSGRLTEEWRAHARASSIYDLIEQWAVEREELKSEKRLKKSFGPKSDPSPIIEDLPQSWAWVKFDHIAEHSNNSLKAGPFGSALKKSDSVDSGFKVYGQEQVIAGDEQLVTYYVNSQKYKQLNACSVKTGDILISLVGTIGKILVLSEKAEAGIINPRLVKLSLQQEINKSFIQIYLESPVAHDFFRGFSHGGTMEILNLGILKELPIPLPPLEEQTEIVRRVDQLFTHANRIEQQVNNALARVNNLTQSILAKAFRGELTEQWRKDNPELISGENSAEALLERIKAERAAMKKPAKKTRKQTTARCVHAESLLRKIITIVRKR